MNTLSVFLCDRNPVTLRLEVVGDNFSKHSERNLKN